MSHTVVPDDEYATVDVLATDFLARYRDGDRPSIEEYARRHPELSDPIRKMFPLVLSVEKLKVDQQTTSDGAVTLAGRLIEQLGDFRLIREIGRGGMGIVYEAEQQSLHPNVAIKLLPKQSLLEDDALARFQREATTAAAMHHSNIVPIFGTGETDGTHYLVMQLVRGKSLDSEIANQGQAASPKECARITMQVADAVAYAHNSGVLHRDLKPANILIDENGTAQITDFGLARNTHDDPTLTSTLSGSLRYMAPERFRGISDQRSDIYGIGLTLYEMLAGKPAFVESDPHQLMDAILAHKVVPLKTLRPEVPIDLDTIVCKAIALEPSVRYQKAEELRDDLRRFLAGEPVLARRTSSLERCLRWCRRNPKIAIASGIAIASLILATSASSAGWILTSAANRRTTVALNQSNETVDLALLSLDGVVDLVAVPFLGQASIEFDESSNPAGAIDPSPQTAQLLASLQPLYERLAQQSPTRPDIIVQMIRANLRLALIQRQLGQTSMAIDSLTRGMEVLRERSEQAELPVAERQLLLAKLNNELGSVYAAELRFKDSDAAYQAGIDAAQSVSESNAAAQLEMARAHVALGDPPPHRRRNQLAAKHQIADQRDHLSQADALLENLRVSNFPDGDINLLRSKIQLAQSRLTPHRFDKQAFFQKAMEILRHQLDVAPDDVAVRFTMAEALADVNPHRDTANPRQLADTLARLQEALTTLRPLRERFPETPLFSSSEVHIRHKLSTVAKSKGDTELASQQLEQAIQIQSSLVDGWPQDSSHRCWRALLYRSVAESCQASGDQAGERGAIQKGMDDLDAIASIDDENPFVIKTRQAFTALESRNANSDSSSQGN